jgi:molecular chaperone DnaK
MTYTLGLDLGTTYTAAATCRDGRCEISPLGNRSAVIPSVVHLGADGTTIVGEAAQRRLTTEPLRVLSRVQAPHRRPHADACVGGAPYRRRGVDGAGAAKAVVANVASAEGGPAGGHRHLVPGDLGPVQARSARVRRSDAPTSTTSGPRSR